MAKESNSRQIRACVNCKLRKVRCDGHPCSNCKNSKTTCILTKDKRSTRPSNSDWNAVNSKIVALENQLDQITNHNNHLLKLFGENNINVQLPDMNQQPPAANITSAATGETITQPLSVWDNTLPTFIKYPKPGEFDKIDNDDPKYVWSAYGPTSIFNQNDDDVNGDGVSDKAMSNFSTLNILNKNPQILKHVKLFFQFMYPDIHMFIPRETFLIDFHHPKPSNQSSYCTKELVYAICAIGSLHDSTFNQSDSYYNIAKNRLFLNLNSSSMPSLQAFILLGLYDIYQCKNDSGWILTGIGFRIGFNLGFHLSPDDNSVSDLTIKFKSRIYWGCFVVDHLLALIFGRPSILHIGDSTIEESGRVPDLDWIKEFNFQGVDGIIEIANPLRAIVTLFVIVEDAMNELFICKSEFSGLIQLHNKLSMVKSFNEKIESWKCNLSDDLKWVQGDSRDSGGLETLKERSTSAPKMNHVLCYYISLLCINRPFLTRSIEPNSSGESEGESREGSMLKNGIQDLESHIVGVIVKCLRELTIALAPPSEGFEEWGSILVVYSAVIGVSTVMMLGNSREYSMENNGDSDSTKRSKWLIGPTNSELGHYEENPLQFQREKELRHWFFSLMGVLERQRGVWLLAGKVFDMVDKKLKNGFGVGFKRAQKAWEKELQTTTLDIPFDVDFSPLDDLWDGEFGDAIVPIEFETLFRSC